MSLVTSFTICTGIYLLGTIISRKTGGRIGSALASIPIMFALFWSGLLTPEDINASQFPAVYAILNAVVLVNVGTTFDFGMLKKQWRLVIVCLSSLAGCALLVFTIGRVLWGRDMVIASYPVLAGGAIAMMLMQNAAIAKGLGELAAIVVLVGTVQGWVSIPLISNLVRVEAKRILKLRGESSEAAEVKAAAAVQEAKPKLYDKLPAGYDTPYMNLFLCAFFSLIAERIAAVTNPLTNGVVGAALVGIFIGVIARALGLIGKDPLSKANVLPFFMMCMVIAMRRSLANLSPAGLLESIGPILGIVLLGAVGLLGVGIVVGRLMGLSTPMAAVVAIQAYSGYPTNFQICLETLEAIAQSPEELQYLKDEIIPKVVIGGVISVSISSVIIAGVFQNLL